MNLRFGTIIQVDNNSGKLQTAQVSGIAGETTSGVDSFTPYGLTSFAMPADVNTGQGAEAILADVFGTGHTTILNATDRRYRPRVGYQGDVILYSNHDNPTASHSTATHRITLTDEGSGTYKIYLKCNSSTILLKSDNTITVSNGSGSVVISADGSINMNAAGSGFSLTGGFNVNGNTVFNGTITANGHRIDETHTHKNVTVGTGVSGVVS